MANSDKNIIITPNTDQSSKPKIEFTGSDDITNTITVEDNGSLSLNRGLSFAEITHSKNITTVDTFIYDTTKDSDGGAWRHRTQGTSWYQETLNTTTRGSTRKFPSVAVIIAEANKVTIFDGDDPTLPMWMVFDRDAGGSTFCPSDVSKLEALNGQISICSNATTSTFRHSFRVVKFLSDSCDKYYSSVGGNCGTFARNISERNVNSLTTLGNLPAIVNSVVNGVAMTVLYDAPVDPATGLQVPTIAVATDGGLSVINNDGNVYDATPDSHKWYSVAFRSFDNAIVGTRFANGRSYILTVYNTPFTANRTDYDEQYGPSNVGGPARDGFLFGGVPTTVEVMRVANNGLAVRTGTHGIGQLLYNPDTPAKFAYAQTTTAFSTGYMVGATKGAWLSDTVAETLVGAELMTNVVFAGATGTTPPTGFTDDTVGTTYALSSGELTIDRSAGTGNGRLIQTVTTVVGQYYEFRLDVVNIALGQARIGQTGGSTAVRGDAGPLLLGFVAASTSTELSIQATQSSEAICSVKNPSVNIAVTDRSPNAEGLKVVGNDVVKAAVATGAELMGFGGFSNTSYLKHDNFSDRITLGSSGKASMMFWSKYSAGAHVIVTNGGQFSSGGNVWGVIGGWTNSWAERGTNMGNAAANTGVPGQWQFVVLTYDSGMNSLYVDGVLVTTPVNAVKTLSAGTPLSVGVAMQGSSASGPVDEICLVRISGTVPSANQITKIYRDELPLFQENAKCTIFGTSDVTTAIEYDESRDLLHVGTSEGRSSFKGLQRVSNTTTAITTSISAVNGMIAEE